MQLVLAKAPRARDSAVQQVRAMVLKTNRMGSGSGSCWRSFFRSLKSLNSYSGQHCDVVAVALALVGARAKQTIGVVGEYHHRASISACSIAERIATSLLPFHFDWKSGAPSVIIFSSTPGLASAMITRGVSSVFSKSTTYTRWHEHGDSD